MENNSLDNKIRPPLAAQRIGRTFDGGGSNPQVDVVAPRAGRLLAGLPLRHDCDRRRVVTRSRVGGHLMASKNCMWALLAFCGSLLTVAAPTVTQAADQPAEQ